MNLNIKNLIKYPKKGILSEEIFKDEKLEVSLFCMAKNTEMSEHTSTKKAVVQVLEGNGIFNLEGKDIEMKDGIFIHMKENAKHSLKAIDNTSFLLWLWK